MAHTQKTAAERAQDIVVAQGGGYAKNKWVETKIAPAREAGDKALNQPTKDSGAHPGNK